MKRILLDRSVFHRSKFDQLRTSPLSSLVQKGKVKVRFGPQFLEETWMYGLQPRTRFATQWRFLTSLEGAKWFKPVSELLALELTGQALGRKYYLQPKSTVTHLLSTSADFVAGRIPTAVLTELKKEISENKRIRAVMRQDRLRMRAKYRGAFRDFGSFFDQHIEPYIEQRLVREYPNLPASLAAWQRARSQSKFTDQFLRSRLAVFYIPIADQNLRLGDNDQADADQLPYLLWADIMVSDDTKFMREAFNLLFGQSDKQFMSLRQFLAFLESNTAAATAPNKPQHGARSLNWRS
jgi:hypothetical protein